MAGLIAAHRLRELGADVTVIEASDRAGGFVRTIRRDGWLFEAGPGIVAGVSSELSTLFDALGVTAEMVHPVAADRQFLVHDGRLVPVPRTTGEILSSPLLSVAGRLRMLREPFVPRGTDADESVTAFARRRFGAEFATHFLEPLVAGTTGGDPEKQLAIEALPVLAGFERNAGSVLKGRMRARRTALREGAVPGRPWSCRQGLSELVDRLATSLGDHIRFNHRVDSVTVDGRGVVVTANQIRMYDALIVALPPPAMKRIAVDASPFGSAATAIGAIPCATATLICLGYRRDQVDHPLDGAVALAPRDAGCSFLSLRFPSAAFPDRVPPGHVLMTAMIGGVLRPDLAALDDAAAIALVIEECRPLLGITGAPVFTEVVRWPERLPQAESGHHARRAVVDAAEAELSRVAFCGAWRDGLAVAEVMMGGWRAAERVMHGTTRTANGGQRTENA